ncbi:MAG: sigma-54-dependent Fis family transcriptional regulator, partial [Bilophila sp.]
MLTDLQEMPDLERLIQCSLKRSASYGIDPHLDGAPESARLTDSELVARIQKQHEFYSLAREQLDSLYRLLKDTGFCMALADKDGYILYIIGDTDLVEHFRLRRCIPGYRWTERDMGTCAIGLSLEERVPIFLPGDRMYAALAQKISNAGAPVFAPDGGLLGAISLSGRSDRMHVHTLGLVR